MDSKRQQHHSRYSHLIAGLLLLPLAAFGQEANDDEPIEEIVVTGSHIQGVSEEVLAVTVMGENEIRDLGAVNMFDLLGYIPAISDFEFEDNSNGTNAVRGDVAGVNMRSLGTGNTLVLINGRRMIVHPTFQPINSVPSTLYNANSIPASAVQRIEVLRDGASAIYGADASAGVVNFITRTGQDGFEVSGKYGASSETNYDESEITARAGFQFNGGKTSLGLFGTFYSRGNVHMNELPELYYELDRRGNEAIPEEWRNDSQLRNDSSLTPWARVSVGSLNEDLRFIGSTYHVDSDTGELVSGSGSERYNFNETAWVTPAVDRFNVMATLNHEMDNGMEFFGDFSYYDSKSNTQRAASPIDDGLAFLIMPSTGFYNTTGEDVLILGWRPVDLGPRTIEVKQDTWRVMAGLRGTFKGWEWESGLVQSEAEAVDVEGNRQAKDLFIDAVSRTDASALNPFAGPGGNPAAAFDAIRIEARDVRSSEITIWDLRLNKNDLFDMGGGPAGFATGLEWRRDYYKDDRDPRLDGSMPYDRPPIFDESNIVGVSATFDSSASRNTTSVYAELFLPFVGEANAKSFTKALEAQLAVRHEETNDFGGATKPKITLRWEPVSGVSLRASYSEGFRAPNLPQLNQGTIVRRIDDIEDPLRSDVTGLPIDTGQTYRITTRIANPNLQPEDTETTMFGLVIAPKSGPLSGFLATFDAWNIKQDGVVGILDPEDALDLDVILRQQGSFNPDVERAAVTEQDQAYFDAWNLANPEDQRTAVGVATNIINEYENLDPREVEGWDAALEYTTPDTRAGTFTFRGDMTKITKFEQLGLAQTNLLRRNGNPELRYTLGVRWRMGGFGANLNVRYVDDVYDTSLWQTGSDVSGTYDEGLNRTYWDVESWKVWNLGLSYDFAGSSNSSLEGLRINAGVRNLTDEEAPFADESYGYFARLHNMYGRVVWGQLTYAF